MSKVLAIAINTYRESVRSKILYALLFFAAALILLSSFFGTVTIGDRAKVIKDFGLASMSLFGVAFSVIAGASLLFKELNRKTIYNILSKPVHRWEFIFGKHLGLLLTLTLMTLLMGISLIGFLCLLGEGVDFSILIGAVYVVLELMIVTAVALLFSSIVVTVSLSGLFAFSIFIAGRSVNYIQDFASSDTAQGALKYVIKGVYYILPHLNQLNISDALVYGVLPTWSNMCWAIGYAVGYTGVILIVATVLFSRRDFN